MTHRWRGPFVSSTASSLGYSDASLALVVTHAVGQRVSATTVAAWRSSRLGPPAPVAAAVATALRLPLATLYEPPLAAHEAPEQGPEDPRGPS